MTTHLPHTDSTTIAVAGGTGRVGSALVAALLDAGATVRILGRDADKARAAFPHTDAVEVDLEQPGTVRAALEGATRLFIGLGSHPAQPRSEIALIDGAVEVGIPYLVKLSSFGGPSTLHPLDWHAEIESHLARQPLGYTVLRPTTFVDVLGLAGPFVKAGTWGGAAGDGRVNLTNTKDVGAVAAAELLDVGDDSVQRSRHLTADRSWSMDEIAAELSLRIGREVAYTQRSSEEQVEVLTAGGLALAHANILVGLDRMYRDRSSAETTTTVQSILGRPPLTVGDWLTENIAKFS